MENRTTAKRLEDGRTNTLTEEEHSEKCTIQLQATSCIGTLVERMINERLNWWLEHTNIITQCQVGSGSNYTTEDQPIRLTQKIQNGFQINKDTIAVFVDLEKTYDKFSRQGLFMKMRDAGMHSNMCRWIKNLLTDRTIAIKTEGVT